MGSCELVAVSNYRLALALFMLGDLADDANDATAMDYLAFVTDLLYGCTDLHSDSLHFPARLEPGRRDTRNDTTEAVAGEKPLQCEGESSELQT